MEKCGMWALFPHNRREWRRRKRYDIGVAGLPAEVREVFLSISLDAQEKHKYDVLHALHDLGAAAGRAEQKRKSNTWTERDRRATVGARLPLDTVARYKACAEREGVTMYRWTVNALEEAWRKCQGLHIVE